MSIKKIFIFIATFVLLMSAISCSSAGTDSALNSLAESDESAQPIFDNELPATDPAIPEGDYKMSRSQVTKEQIVQDIETELTTVDRYHFPYTPWNLDNFKIVYATVLIYGCPNLQENGSVDKSVFDYLVKVTFSDGIQESTQDFALSYEDLDKNGVFYNTSVYHSGSNIHEELNGSIPIAPPDTEGYPFYSTFLKYLLPELTNYCGKTITSLNNDETKATVWERGQPEVEYWYLAQTETFEYFPVCVVFVWNDTDAAYLPCEVFFNGEDISGKMENIMLVQR